MKGPEDSPQWLRFTGDSEGSSVETCQNCGVKIQFWHCADGGCPWCASCGSKIKDIREKRKNGET